MRPHHAVISSSLLLAVALGGCVHVQVTPKAESVRLTSNAEEVQGCQLVGHVEGRDRLNGGILGQRAAEENAQRALRNNAARMGANTVLVVSGTTGMTGSRQQGEAYACSQKPPS